MTTTVVVRRYAAYIGRYFCRFDAIQPCLVETVMRE
jgi:hypothetical protein